MSERKKEMKVSEKRLQLALENARETLGNAYIQYLRAEKDLEAYYDKDTREHKRVHIRLLEEKIRGNPNDEVAQHMLATMI
jgi:hypothetical protein